ncbi:MAG: LysR substrate-binding domain-containing protein [Pseudomonadota bacterium]
MNHSQLRAFHAVATEGSFTGAAHALRVSQPTLSAHVRLLEEGYGVDLFERRGRSIQLTEFGRSLKEITNRYFSVEQEAETLLLGARDRLRGRLQVAADSPFYMITLLAAYARRYPDVRQILTFGNSETVLKRVMNGSCDVGFFAELRGDDNVYARPISRDRLVAIVSKEHALAGIRQIGLSELQTETVLLRERGSMTRTILEAELERQGIVLRLTMEMGSREAVREAAAGGLGVGVMNSGETGEDGRLLQIAIEGDGLELTEYIACLKTRTSTPQVAALMDMAEAMKPG